MRAVNQAFLFSLVGEFPGAMLARRKKGRPLLGPPTSQFQSGSAEAVKPAYLLAVCRHFFLNLRFHRLEVEACALLHGREVDRGFC